MIKSWGVKIVFTVLVVFIVLKALSALYHFALLHNKNLKASYVSTQQLDADVLFHGPCQPQWMIQPLSVEKHTGLKTYNLGLTHADFADNYLHLYLYLKHNKSPEYLFLYVSPESMDLKYNTFTTYRFAAFMDDSVVSNVVRECDKNYYKWTKIPFMNYAYYGNDIHFDAVQGLKHCYYGTDAYYPSGYEPLVFLTGNFTEIYPENYLFIWDAYREKYLRKIIAMAMQKGIKIILYESPVYKQSQLNTPNRSQIINKIKAIAQEYKIPYWQYEDAALVYERHNFVTSVILNQSAAAAFSDSIAKQIALLVK